MNINDRIRLIRKEMGITQAEFADKLNVTSAAVSILEHGKATVTKRLISSICREFNVNEEWLETGNGPMFATIPRDEKIAQMVAEAIREDDFRAKFISMLTMLTPVEWKLLEEMANKLLAIQNAEKEKDDT